MNKKLTHMQLCNYTDVHESKIFNCNNFLFGMNDLEFIAKVFYGMYPKT